MATNTLDKSMDKDTGRSVEASAMRELMTQIHNARCKLHSTNTNITICHLWGMLATVGYSTHHWIGATIALVIAVFMKP
jgi:hypothetical protein